MEAGDEYGIAIGIFARGHVDIEEFCKAYNHGYNYSMGERKFAEATKTRHVYARYVPYYAGGMQIAYTNTPGRGAFPLTVMDF